MNISEMYNIEAIVRELEKAFLIDAVDYQEKDLNILLRNVRKRLTHQNAIDLVRYNLNSDELSADEVQGLFIVYLDNLTRIHAQLCGCLHIYRYLADIRVSLREVNFIGFTEESMKNMLQTLMRKQTIPSAQNAVETLKVRMSSVSNSIIKRLFVLLIVSYEIGCHEIMSAIAEVLYMGGRK